MFRKITHYIDRLGAPELDWIQVEVSTHCRSSCIYCPQTVLGKHMARKHMPLDLFRKLIPFIKYTNMIYLQGWGEPLLHPEIFEMIRICKKHKKKVGLTTNGMLLNEKTIEKILDAGVDILGISLAGTRPETHNAFRRGNDFNRLMNNLALLNRIKKRTQSILPDLHFAYLMLKSNFHELEHVIPLAEKLNVKLVVASNLSLILNASLFSEALFNDHASISEYIEKLEDIKRLAIQQGILFAYSSPVLEETRFGCSENVGNACVVSVDGDIVPCVFMDPVLSDEVYKTEKRYAVYRYMNKKIPLKGISFGNIQDKSLTHIWNKKEYMDFRNGFSKGIDKKFQPVLTDEPFMCRHCYKRLTTYN